MESDEAKKNTVSSDNFNIIFRKKL